MSGPGAQVLFKHVAAVWSHAKLCKRPIICLSNKHLSVCLFGGLQVGLLLQPRWLQPDILSRRLCSPSQPNSKVPSHSFRWFLWQAEVGDDVLGDDPTVKALEAAAAKKVGKENALLVPSGTMGNLIAVLAHCSERGAEVIVGDESHVYVYEAGGMSVRGTTCHAFHWHSQQGAEFMSAAGSRCVFLSVSLLGHTGIHHCGQGSVV